jgi:hypothetical protein
MPKFLKTFIVIFALGGVLYFVVDEPTRAKFDNGYTEQMITLREIKNKTYLVLWEFFGAYDTEVAAQKIVYDKDIVKRRQQLQERRNTTERLPAFVPKSNFDKFKSQ